MRINGLISQETTIRQVTSGPNQSPTYSAYELFANYRLLRQGISRVLLTWPLISSKIKTVFTYIAQRLNKIISLLAEKPSYTYVVIEQTPDSNLITFVAVVIEEGNADIVKTINFPVLLELLAEVDSVHPDFSYLGEVA
jgi:hypothetical protein